MTTKTTTTLYSLLHDLDYFMLNGVVFQKQDEIHAINMHTVKLCKIKPDQRVEPM